MVRADTFNKRTQEVTVERRKTQAEVNARRLKSVSNGTYSNRNPLCYCALEEPSLSDQDSNVRFKNVQGRLFRRVSLL